MACQPVAILVSTPSASCKVCAIRSGVMLVASISVPPMVNFGVAITFSAASGFSSVGAPPST